MDGKPDWKDAPEWVEYLAMDESGEWYWYKRRPITNGQRGIWESNDSVRKTGIRLQWENTLEKRPNE